MLLPEDFPRRCQKLLERLHAALPRAWAPPHDAFCAAIAHSYDRHGAGRDPGDYAQSLKIEDLALATACAAGSEPAWEHFYAQFRGPLRAAGRSLAGASGEELADSLFGELYAQRAKLASFAGRSSLAGWLRAVLYQSYVDRLRATRKETSLEERAEAGAPEPSAPFAGDPVEQAEYDRIARQALDTSLGRLPPRQKLMLDFYYFHGLTLREAAALTGVHEATASRELERARQQLKEQLHEVLRKEYRLSDEEIRACLYEAARTGIGIGERLQDSGTPAVPE